MALPQIVTLSAEGLTGLFPVQASTGSGSAGDIPALNSDGQIDSTMLPPSGGGSSGVTSFDGRTGAVTLNGHDIVNALGYIINPYGMATANFLGVILSAASVNSESTAGDVTVSASDIFSSYFVVTATQTAAFTVTTDTGGNIVSLISGGVPPGASFKLRVINNDQSATGYALTLAGGTGVTISTTLPNPAVPKGAWADYLFVASGGSAITVTYVGQGTI